MKEMNITAISLPCAVFFHYLSYRQLNYFMKTIVISPLSVFLSFQNCKFTCEAIIIEKMLAIMHWVLAGGRGTFPNFNRGRGEGPLVGGRGLYIQKFKGQPWFAVKGLAHAVKGLLTTPTLVGG